jgi:uncharacterized protein
MYIYTHINQYKFKTKVLKTDKEIYMGMMGKNFNRQFDALLFLISSKQCSFWMKNCIVHLDILFIQNGKINKIHHNCPPCDNTSCKTYSGKGDLVIELPGGTSKLLNIKKGDKIEFYK